MNSTNRISLQYQGYLNTALLWQEHTVFGLEQIQVMQQRRTDFKMLIPENLRLGKRVELFVFEEFSQIESIEVLLQNKQVQNGKTTIGEIDCVLKQDGIPIHLEIVYKFYLYDAKVGSSEIEHWIGPNRNDTLTKKLIKLKDKQFPLIYKEQVMPLLANVNVKSQNLLQKVLFKAQLFIPYKAKMGFDLLNKNCLAGFYIYHSALHQFSDYEFFIPDKLDWLIEVHSEVDWISYNQFQKATELLLNDKKSPLCWIRFSDTKIQKFFVVWWDESDQE